MPGKAVLRLKNRAERGKLFNLLGAEQVQRSPQRAAETRAFPLDRIDLQAKRLFDHGAGFEFQPGFIVGQKSRLDRLDDALPPIRVHGPESNTNSVESADASAPSDHHWSGKLPQGTGEGRLCRAAPTRRLPETHSSEANGSG